VVTVRNIKSASFIHKGAASRIQKVEMQRIRLAFCTIYLSAAKVFDK
jgi:hypothetical protein